MPKPPAAAIAEPPGELNASPLFPLIKIDAEFDRETQLFTTAVPCPQQLPPHSPL
jgi:hypothetical protein